MSSVFAYLEPPSRALHDRRHSTEHARMTPPTLSRNSSATSVTSHKSEPGWLTAMNNVDRSRSSSVPPTRSISGISKLFGKKKDKKDSEPIVITSKHAGAVKNKLAHDPRFKSVRRESAPAQVFGVVGTVNSLHITAGEQETRHPHSGPPALHAPKNKADLPLLTRIISGDEVDEPDDFEKKRENWRQRKEPTLDIGIIEGQVLDGKYPGQAIPGKEGTREMDIPPSEVVERQGVRILSVEGMTGDDYEPRPSRTHAPFGSRWKKDEKGVWKR